MNQSFSNNNAQMDVHCAPSRTWGHRRVRVCDKVTQRHQDNSVASKRWPTAHSSNTLSQRVSPFRFLHEQFESERCTICRKSCRLQPDSLLHPHLSWFHRGGAPKTHTLPRTQSVHYTIILFDGTGHTRDRLTWLFALHLPENDTAGSPLPSPLPFILSLAALIVVNA